MTEEQQKESEIIKQADMPCYKCWYVYNCKYFSNIGWNNVILINKICPPAFGYPYQYISELMSPSIKKDGGK